MKDVQCTGQRKITNGKSMICKPKYRKFNIELPESHSNLGMNSGRVGRCCSTIDIRPESGDKSWTGLRLRRTEHISGHRRLMCLNAQSNVPTVTLSKGLV